ncbi:MAG: M50 family metallopeptidase [Minicystis sp.]
MARWYSYLVGALALALLMIVHECGHFFVARAFGMRVTKFSIGFGPTFFKIVPDQGYFWFTTAANRVRLRLWKHDPERHGPTVYQVAMIPFLAYVQIAGMNPLEDIDEQDKGSYANASLIGRILTIFGGPAANYLFASVLFFASFFFGGRLITPEPDAPRSTEVTVIEGRPAAAAQVKSGDRIVEVAGVHVDKWKEMADVISKHPGETIPLVVDRNGQRVALNVTPLNEGGKGKIGVALMSRKVNVSAKEAATLAVKTPPVVVKNLVVGLSEFITGKVEGELSGPVGMVKETARVARIGWTDLLFFMGSLSAYLGAFNLIPFPALDGGRLMFLGYEATTRRRPNARIEAHIHFIGLFMMIGLMVYVTVNDIRRSDRPSPNDPPPASSSAAPPATPPPPSGK